LQCSSPKNVNSVLIFSPTCFFFKYTNIDQCDHREEPKQHHKLIITVFVQYITIKTVFNLSIDENFVE